MHLKQVLLRNFRCFEKLEFNLHPRLTVLVAENGGGKTAILDGIAIGLSPILRYLSSANQRLSGPGIEDTDFRLKQWETRTGEERWGASDYAQIAVETTDGLTWDIWRASAKGKQPESKIGQSDLAAYGSSLLDSIQTKTPKLLPVFAYYGARRGWIVIPERLRETKVNYDHPASALVGALESLSDFKEMLKWFDSEEAAELRANRYQGTRYNQQEPQVRMVGNRPVPVGYGTVSTLHPERSALTDVRNVISNLLGGDYSNPRFDAKHKFIVDSKHEPNVLQVSQLSQGYQSMLALGMDFARRLALANSHLYHVDDSFDWSFAQKVGVTWGEDRQADMPALGPVWAPAIMLVDEIDLHLHPSWQQRVLTDLLRTFPNTQFIVTTHSPQVISTVRMESIRILRDGIVYAAPPGTDGAEAQRILEDVFLVSPRAKTPMAEALNEYLRLVDERQWEIPRAVELRKKLDQWSQGQEPRLLEADLQIENMKWENGQ